MSRRSTIGLVVAVAALACGRTMPDVDPPLLTVVDLDVMRTVVESVVRPSVTDIKSPLVVESPTRVLPLWHRPQPRSFPPPPPSGFGGAVPAPRSLPPPPPEVALDDSQLTLDERPVWEARNRRARPIPGLAVAGLSSRHDGRLTAVATVGLSAPAYVTQTAAVVYADLHCGVNCGKGWLIRLIKVGDGWRIEQQLMIWIS